LWINNVLIIDKWFDHASTAYTATVNLAQGQPISMRMEYYENSGNASAKLEWKIPTVAKRVIAFDACPLGGVFNTALCYRLSARHSNKVMALTANSAANGVAVVQNTWTGTREQVWRIKQIDATFYELANGFSGKSATVQNNSTADLAPIIQSNYIGTNNQQFKFDRNTEGYYTITARNSNKALDVTGSSLADRAAIIQYRSTTTANQQWRVESVGCPVGTAALATNRVVAFNGYLDNQKGVLQWVVNSDDLKDYYDLEKMDANQNFTRLTSINGNSADALRSFSFTDDNLEDGENVYRVKAIDKDGSVQFSNSVTVKYQEPNTYALSPNPTQDYVDVNLSTCENRPVVLTIMDALGHKVQSVSLDKAGKSHRIEFGDIATGQYFLHIQPAGKRVATRVIIVSK
jgi:Ricin-type beta-trefoil lectin domain-like/Secretion system C-terminal sorting domain/PA14 domain